MPSITDQTPGVIIKSDSTGRTRYTQQYKQEVLDAFETSSLSAPAFASQCGIKYPTFAAWIAGRRRGGRQPSHEGPAFLIAEIPSSMDATLEVRLPGGAVVLASTQDQIPLLAALLRHLA